ncbi:unnamed protein product [Adineta ricciae]|uniref:Protein kinase domain-containing protein n=1 Tax=Adineta ricciae TaxID=249248 RepID=A0A816F0Y8_ADIRI|nr:unnamed protein product [Adineta ricciae]
MNEGNTNEYKWYTIDIGGTQFKLPVRYQNVALITQDVNSVIVRAIDTETNKYVAIKKVNHLFQNSIWAKRIYVKLKLLIHFNHREALVVQLRNVYTPEQNLDDFQTLYFVFNYVDYDLNAIIRCYRWKLPEDRIKYYIYSLLRILKFIHSAGISHRNLKPENIGFNRSSNITVGYYKVFLGDKRYGDKLDIWSVGCIMGEFILGQPLFCGDDSLDQFDQIFDIIGTPDLAILNDYKISEITSYIRRLPVRPRIDYNECFGYRCSPTRKKVTYGISPEGIDFLDSLLTFDYRMRPTVEEALMHPYLKEYHNPAKEPTAELFLDENVDEDYEIDTWKNLIWQMVQEFEPPSWANEIDETVEL